MAKKGRNSGDKDEEGPALWEHVTRSVLPYQGRKSPLSKTSARPPALRKERAVPPPPRPRGGEAVPKAPPRGFDKATETRFRKGKLELEARLDLHGMTQEEAFRALYRFIHTAVAQEKRTLLIITGKGKLGGGVLKRLLPLWFEEDGFLSRHLLALTPAQPKDGGSGAFYVRLRKPRSA